MAPVPYSSPTDYASVATTTAVVYSTDTSVAAVGTAAPYTSPTYTYDPPAAGTGTAPSGYSSRHPARPHTYVPPPQPTAYSTSSSNATCSGATLNVLEASLDWWYTKTLYYAVSTFSVQFNSNDSATGWTVLPATTTFDVESALSVSDCSATPTFVSSLNTTRYQQTCTPQDSPVAAETTIITQTAFKDPPARTGNGSIPNVVITPKPASISVSEAAQTPYAQGTPFVFFSQYEIVSKSVTTYENGSAGCAEATQTYTMDEPFSFEYEGADVNGSLSVNEGVVGDVNPALLGLVGQDTAVAGSWVAEPTVVLLVQKVFVAQAALAATAEPTAPSLDTPTPTPPPFVTLAPTGPQGPPKITNSPRIESSQSELLVPTPPGDDHQPTDVGPAEQTQGSNGGGGQGSPDQGGRPFTSLVAFIAHIAHSETTLQVPAAPTQNVITTQIDGQTVTATRASAVEDNSGQQGGFGGLIGAINSAAQQPPAPTNALDVLTEAMATFPGHNPTANAIINGMGGPASNGGGGGSPQAQEDNLPGGSRAITVGDAVITPDAYNAYDMGHGATLTPGGTAVMDGTTISLDAGATIAVVDGVTQRLASPAHATGGPAADIPLITVDRAAVTPNAATEYSIAPGATLTPGGSVVVDGTTMSLDSAATALVVNGVTQTLASPTGGAGAIPAGAASASGTAGGAGVTTKPPILTIDGRTYHAINGGTTYVIDGETLTMGGEETVTIDGTAYEVSLAPEATRLTIETENANGQVTATSTETLFPEQGSGSGSGPTSSANASQSTGPEQQVGNVASTSSILSWSGVSFACGSLFLAVWL